MAPKGTKKKTTKGGERPPAIDKLMLPAIGIGLALLGYQFISGINNEILRVNVLDELELREVFFGEGEAGKSYAVLCHEDDPAKNIPVSSVFQEASNDGSAPADFRLLDCNHTLESGKTVAERFNLKLKQRPTIFVSGKVGEPKQVPAKHLKTGNMLVKALKNLLEPKAEKIETTQDLRSKCLEKDMCALLLKGSKNSPGYVKDAMTKLLVEHPKMTFGVVDASVLYVLNLEEHLPEMEPGVPRFVMFQKVSGSTTKESSARLKTSIATLASNGVSYGAMSNLVASVVSQKEEMKKISTLPSIKTRTKKLVEDERAKRQRKLDQQRRMNDKESGASSSSGGGQFETNDGTADGRRAERERRRDEHRASNPNFREKTPEEIAEIERRRRQRMEEEAAKWNIAPEDAPEEGEPLGEEGSTSYMDDADEDDGAGSAEEDDDEDVMDLD